MEEKDSKMTLEAWIGLSSIAIAVWAFAIVVNDEDFHRPPIFDSVVETHVADALTAIPSQTPHVVIVTATPAPIPTIRYFYP